ncbi:MAG TPA: beta/gamma crystallin-related protein [Caulobacteraceae bacterium]|jgi:hypothetical protein|nr:beta/gamma crystallin-related protein [Caulobacteraceae bacterium]
MKTAARLLAGACAALATAGLAGAAQAQRATLYEYPNFQGRSITVDRGDNNLANDNFNDTAQSGHFDGDWTVCTDSDLRGQCQRVAGDVPNLNQFGVGRSISSLQQGGPGGERWGDTDRRGDRDYGDRGYDQSERGPLPGAGYGGGYGGGRWEGGVPGRSVVFFARPRNDGQDIAAYDRNAADWFCRRQGLGRAVYYDVSERGRGFRWQGGGFALNAPVLRDVVCRKF